jgi:opacity protein-like surface antigen
MKNTHFLATTALLITASPAFSADQDYPPAPPMGLEDLRGNIHVGSKVLIDTSSDETGFIPELRIGTKLAYEPAYSDFGFQADLEYGGVPLKLVSPDVGAGGGIHDFVGTGHLTWIYNDMYKFGLYGGYERLSINIDGLDAGSALGLLTIDPDAVEVNVSGHAYQAGLEAMMSVDSTSWLQVRAGIIDPVSLTAEATDGTTTAGGSSTDSSQDVIGWQLGAGYRAGIAENWSVRLDANYTRYLISGTNDLGIWNLLATTQYAFSDLPLALSGSVGYISANDGTSTSDWWVARTGMSWSFGDNTSDGLRGRLFKSVNYQGDTN